jgi:hypothetical protein
MKIYYLNDEQMPMHVAIKDDEFYAALNNGEDLSRWHVTLQSCESRVFDLVCPPGSIPYVKKWPQMVMISYIDPAVAAQLGQARHSPGDA